MSGTAKRFRWWHFLGAAFGGMVFQGCALDPDLWLRAGVSIGSDAAIFLLENLAVGL